MGRRSVGIAAASLLVLYVGLTVGAQAVSAIGVGVAKPPSGVDHAVYMGVRLDDKQLGDRRLLGAVDRLGVSAVVDAQTARRHSGAIDWLADRGVEIANGGWGEGTLLPWNQARNDLDKAGKVIAQEAGAPPIEFVSARRPDAFDQFFSRRAKQRLVVPNHTFGPGDVPKSLENRKVYLLDGRGSDTRSMEAALDRLEQRVDRGGFRTHPLGELR
jgi:hypothetical protein